MAIGEETSVEIKIRCRHCKYIFFKKSNLKTYRCPKCKVLNKVYETEVDLFE